MAEFKTGDKIAFTFFGKPRTGTIREIPAPGDHYYIVETPSGNLLQVAASALKPAGGVR